MIQPESKLESRIKKTLGIIGLGKIGSRVATAALGLGMNVVVYDPFASQELVENIGAKSVKTLDELWGICDFITVHVPKTKDTLNLINKDSIAKMKDGVRLINCARGGIINEQDLKDGIESGKIAAAAIDVGAAAAASAADLFQRLVVQFHNVLLNILHHLQDL